MKPIAPSQSTPAPRPPVAVEADAPRLPRGQLLAPRLPPGAAVKLIGLGGVGSIVARYGALFLASLRTDARLVLIDGDAFEPSNATRMWFGRPGNKARVLCEELMPRLRGSLLLLLAQEEYVTAANIQRLIRAGDLVLLAVDNHATRKLVNDHCARLPDVALISGGNDGIETDHTGTPRRGTYGNVQIFLRARGRDVTPALTHRHPEIERPPDRLPTERSCTELMTQVPQILFANLAVASAMLNALWLCLSGRLHYGEVAFDIAEARMRPVWPLPNFVGWTRPEESR